MKIFLDDQQINAFGEKPRLLWFRAHRFTIFFVAILALFVALPVLEGRVRILIPLLFLLIAFTVLFTLDLKPAAFGVCLAVGLFATTLHVLGRALEISVTSETNLVLLALGLDILFLSFVIYVLVVKIFAEEQVTGETIKGGISVYFLLGYLWAYIYSLVLLLSPEAISFSVAKVELSNVIYFSFTTLTTLGYGDVTPVNWMARNLTILESTIGQIFLTVLIARLVGMQLAHRYKRVRDPREEKQD